MTYQTRLYFHGLFAAFLGGFSNSVVLMIIDPTKFNFADFNGLKNLLFAATGSGIFSFFIYIKDHPLPDPAKDIDAVSAAKIKTNDLVKAME